MNMTQTNDKTQPSGSTFRDSEVENVTPISLQGNTMKRHSVNHPEPLPKMFTLGSILAAFLINFMILWYAVSISVPQTTIVSPVQMQTVSVASGTDSVSIANESAVVEGEVVARVR